MTVRSAAVANGCFYNDQSSARYVHCIAPTLFLILFCVLAYFVGAGIDILIRGRASFLDCMHAALYILPLSKHQLHIVSFLPSTRVKTRMLYAAAVTTMKELLATNDCLAVKEWVLESKVRLPSYFEYHHIQVYTIL
jgi:hypothetical protein